MRKTSPGRGYGRSRSHSRSDGEIPDPERIKEILIVVSERVPDLLRKLSDVLYGPDQAKKFGRAAAVFYNELKGTGMSEDEIFELTRDYLATLNVGNVFSGIAKDHEHDFNREFAEEYEDELDEELEKHVRKRFNKRFENE